MAEQDHPGPGLTGGSGQQGVASAAGGRGKASRRFRAGPAQRLDVHAQFPRGRLSRPGPGRALRLQAVVHRQGKQLLLEGQYAQASDAFQGFVETYGDTPNGPEARYWLAETLYIRGLYSDAATAYIGAIRGWPQTNWAPDAVVKLARTLIALKKTPEACKTLGEFTRRYPDASPPSKARAADARAAAKCS